MPQCGVAVPDDPLREDALVVDPPEDMLRDDTPDPGVAPEPDAASVAALDDRPTTELPRVTAPPVPPPPPRSWAAGLAPWAVFAAVGVVVIIATSTWAAWLQGPTSARQAATPRIDPVPVLTSPAPPAPATVAPPPSPEPEAESAVEPERDPGPTARSSERAGPTRQQAPARRIDPPPASRQVAVQDAETSGPAQPPPRGAAAPDAATSGEDAPDPVEPADTGAGETDEEEDRQSGEDDQ